MDSSLLNVYHDDPYDTNFDHFECTDPEIWSTDNIGIGSMELTETLDGILPIEATETHHDICNIMFEDNHIYDDSEFIEIRKSNALVYNDFAQQQLKAEERVGAIDTDVLSNDGSHVGINEKTTSIVQVEDFANIGDDDVRSECSEISFRTRTDSSSIGDYESHTSDYDDDEDNAFDDADLSDTEYIEEELEKDDVLSELPEVTLLNTDNFMFTAYGKKQRTISTNTIGSDVDAANFDLAEFITSDDVLAKPEKTVIQQPIQMIEPVVQVISSKFDENDSDSDVIVDVETIEFEEHAHLLKNDTDQLPGDSLLFVDNVKDDPSWSPDDLKSKQNFNKKHSDSTKIGKQRIKCAVTAKSNNKLSAKKQILKITPTNVQIGNQNVGMGKGGKNLAALKRDCESIENNNLNKIRAKEKDIALLKHDCNRIDPRLPQNRDNSYKKNEPEKRKLNLEEYKRRHGEDFSNLKTNTTANNKPISSTQTTQNNIKAIFISPNKQTPIKAKPQHSEAVTLIVKSLKEEQLQNSNKKTDPITQAKNKVLRMQEIKKAQQMKIIDSTISAKVPRVTKLLPLQEIIKDTAYAIKNDKEKLEVETMQQQQQNTNTEYVKIVMVSTACNTALSLSPNDLLPNVPLLDNITRVTERVKISNNSLITSIQDAVVKQNLPKIPFPTLITPQPESSTNATKLCDIGHGEDKIIMHLRKDRIRGPTRSIAMQTDFQAAFPTLPMPEKFRKSYESKKDSSRRKYRKRHSSNAASISSSSSSSSSSDSSHSDDDADNEGNVSDIVYVSTKQNRSNNVCGTSMEYQNSEAAVSVGGYSSRSSRRHRSSVSSSYSESGHQRRSRSRKRKSSYKKTVREHSRSSSYSSTLSEYTDRSRSRNRTRSRSPFYRDSRARHESSDHNVSKPAVEERRIVYVGRIEEETTKEMLRRKFIVYGSIKQITIHYKETGMKYGFVTFERSQDAFSVIDNSAQDSQINMYDISFGGRRAFCRTSYADLDNAGINNYHSYVFPKAPAPPKPEDSFEALLQKVKAKLDANKTSNNNKT